MDDIFSWFPEVVSSVVIILMIAKASTLVMGLLIYFSTISSRWASLQCGHPLPISHHFPTQPQWQDFLQYSHVHSPSEGSKHMRHSWSSISISQHKSAGNMNAGRFLKKHSCSCSCEAQCFSGPSFSHVWGSRQSDWPRIWSLHLSSVWVRGWMREYSCPEATLRASFASARHTYSPWREEWWIQCGILRCSCFLQTWPGKCEEVLSWLGRGDRRFSCEAEREARRPPMRRACSCRECTAWSNWNYRILRCIW